MGGVSISLALQPNPKTCRPAGSVQMLHCMQIYPTMATSQSNRDEFGVI